MTTTYISQGERATGCKREILIATTLGSCVSICLWDPQARVGGMNHMLLPENVGEQGQISEGAIDMEELINAMVRLGADRRRLRAKVFGGASMLGGRTDIGGQNVRFADNYLKREGIARDAGSTGGVRARQLRFWPESGVARQKLVDDVPELKVRASRQNNDVELF